jgi:hypothetical protein
MSESGVPGFTTEQLEEYLDSGDTDPIFQASAGVDSSAEIYEINGRLILKWSTCEWTESGIRVLDTNSLDDARSIAEDQVSDLASEYSSNFDSYLELGPLAGSRSIPDRFYPLPENVAPVASFVLVSDFDQGECAEIILYANSTDSEEIGAPMAGQVILAFSSDIGLVVGEFDSLEEVRETVMEEPPGFTLKFQEWTG